MPESSMTSTSTVGLPRESRISRAETLSMMALVVKLIGRLLTHRSASSPPKTRLVTTLATFGNVGDTPRWNEGEPPRRRASATADAAADLQLPGSVRRRSGAGEAHRGNRGLQPPKTVRPGDAGRQAADQEIEHPAARAHRLGENPHCPDPRQLPRGPVHD